MRAGVTSRVWVRGQLARGSGKQGRTLDRFDARWQDSEVQNSATDISPRTDYIASWITYNAPSFCPVTEPPVSRSFVDGKTIRFVTDMRTAIRVMLRRVSTLMSVLVRRVDRSTRFTQHRINQRCVPHH